MKIIKNMPIGILTDDVDEEYCAFKKEHCKWMKVADDDRHGDTRCELFDCWLNTGKYLEYVSYQEKRCPECLKAFGTGGE